MKIRKAVIPVAGFGTRFLPATKAMPKEMLPVVDKPIIQYIVEEMVESGIEEIILVTGRNKRAIEDHFDRNFELEHLLEGNEKKAHLLEETVKANTLAKFVYVRQQEQLGNGHALLQAKNIVGDEPFAFAFGDDIFKSEVPVTKQLINTFEKHGQITLGTLEIDPSQTSNYGIIDGTKIEEGLHQVNGFVEKPDPEDAPSNLASVARFVLTPDVFDRLENAKPGNGGEIVLGEVLNEMISETPMMAHVYQNATYYDCGNKAEYIKAVIDYSLERDDLKDNVMNHIKSL